VRVLLGLLLRVGGVEGGEAHFGVTVAISVTFPLFLIAREVRLAARQTGDVTTNDLAIRDIVGFAGLCALAAWLCCFTLFA
jgi:hypothetical protein